jgi:hypothetical protein
MFQLTGNVAEDERITPGVSPSALNVVSAGFAGLGLHQLGRSQLVGNAIEKLWNGYGAAVTLHQPLVSAALVGLGVGAIALGRLGSVVAVRHVNQALGMSDLIGGLFVTGLLCAMPEMFAAWSLGRRGQVTTSPPAPSRTGSPR